MKIHALRSSSIDQVSDLTDQGKGILIQFRNGKIYSVPEADETLLQAFLESESAGAFFNKVIRPNYEVVPIEDEWVSIGTACEDIKTGDRLEVSKTTGQVRKLRLPDPNKL